MAITRLSIIKSLELILVFICVGLHYHSYDCGDVHRSMLVTGTFVGYTIILVGCFAGHFSQTPFNRRIDLFFTIVGCALFIASGAMILNASGSSDLKDKNTAKAVLAIINGVLFLLDSVLRLRGE